MSYHLEFSKCEFHLGFAKCEVLLWEFKSETYIEKNCKYSLKPINPSIKLEIEFRSLNIVEPQVWD